MGLERVWSGFAGGGSGFRVSSEWVDSGFRAEMCCGNEAGSYLRLTDSCITQLEAHGPSRTCTESKEEEEDKGLVIRGHGLGDSGARVQGFTGLRGSGARRKPRL